MSYPESSHLLTSGWEASDPGKFWLEVRNYQTSSWIVYA